MAQGDGVNWEDPEQATAELIQSLAGMSSVDVHALNESQLNLINVMTGRIEYAEARRGGFATIAAGFIAAGIVLLTFSLGDHSWRVSLLVGTFGGGLILSGAGVLWLFGRQTNPNYGFIKKTTRLERPWKWFYRDALSDSNAFVYHWFKKGTNEANLVPAREFDRQWGAFAERQLSLSDERVDTLQNIKQVYLLHVNERYKNLFLTEVRRTLIWGLVGTVLLTGVIFVGSLFCGDRVSSSSTTPSASVQTSTP